MQSSPELMKLFGEDPEEQEQRNNFIPAKPPSRSQAVRPTGMGKQPGMETPRDFEEELTEEQMLRLELEKVKHERETLMQSIMSAKSQIGEPAGTRVGATRKAQWCLEEQQAVPATSMRIRQHPRAHSAATTPAAACRHRRRGGTGQ